MCNIWERSVTIAFMFCCDAKHLYILWESSDGYCYLLSCITADQDIVNNDKIMKIRHGSCDKLLNVGDM